MPEYQFVTLWKLDAPIEQVYDAILDTQRWSSWWSNIERVEVLQRAKQNGVGQVERFTFRTELPYKLRFDLTVTRNERPTCIEGQASGELDGIGRWTFAREGKGTVVNYLWAVRTTRWWMNLFAPIARPFFARNHEAVMRNGGRALARHLDTKLTHEEYIELDPKKPTPTIQPAGNRQVRDRGGNHE